MDESLGSVGILLMGLGAAFYLLAGGCVIEPFKGKYDSVTRAYREKEQLFCYKT